MWGHAQERMASNSDLCIDGPLSSPRWRPSLLAENNQVRCESHRIARRVGGPSRAAADKPTSSGGGDRVYPFLRAVDQKKSAYFTAPLAGAMAVAQRRARV